MSSIVDYFLSPTGLITIATLAAAVGGIYYYQVLRKQTRVWYLRPRDMRGLELVAKRETSYGLECEKKGGVLRTFVKVGRGYMFPGGGARFLGIEGTAYTGETTVTSEDINGEEQPLKTQVSFPEALKTLWTKTEYDKMPANLRDAVEKTQWGLTVEAKRIDEEALGLKPMSEDQIKKEQRQEMLKDLAEAEKEAQKPNLIWIAVGVAFGFFACYLLANMHYLPVAPK